MADSEGVHTDSVVGVLVNGGEIVAYQGTWEECDDYINSHITPPDHIARWELRANDYDEE
jgi:hypothetical protein